MSILVNIHDLRHQFSHRTLFEGLTFSIFEGEKIALIGQNGAGKSTLMKMIAGQMQPDGGRVTPSGGARIGYLTQAPEFDPEITVRQAVYAGIDEDLDWSQIGIAEETMSRLNLAQIADQKMGSLSGGWKKKVALAHELALDPDLLLMDEPTNHLDVDSILWLEDWVKQSRMAVMIISHDRSFLQRTGKRVIEIDRRNPNGILSVDGNYTDFLQVKADYIENQISRKASMENVLRRENEWLSRGPKARTTKQKARIDRAGDLEGDLQDLRAITRTQTVKLEFDAVERLPKKLVELKGVTKGYDGRTLFKNLDLKITPTTRLGLMGKNGTGKSTLIRLLMGLEEADTGTIERSERLEASYFEQSRETLDPELTVLRTVCPYGETVEYQGRKMHVRSYLDRFLFSDGQVEQSVSKLSGGEQARLLLARQMLRPANLLVLDEPTNDLDLQTLAVLEDCLKDFPGAVILVTHDRSFMDAVCNQILAFPEMTTFAEIDQWEKWFKANLRAAAASGAKVSASLVANANASGNSTKSAPPVESSPKKKLSFKEQQEFDQMEGVILKKETALKDAEENSKFAEMAKLQTEIEALYARWAEFEARGAKRSN